MICCVQIGTTIAQGDFILAWQPDGPAHAIVADGATLHVGELIEKTKNGERNDNHKNIQKSNRRHYRQGTR